MARALARQFDLPFVQLPEEIPQRVRDLVTLDFQAEHRFVLFGLEREARGERLLVAVDDPSDLTVVGELSFQLNKPIRVHVAAEDDIDRALDLVSGRAVGLLAPEEDVSGPPVLEHVSEGPPPSSAAAAAVSALLDWDVPTLITPRSALKPKPPMPPAPPPFDEDEDITLLTPWASSGPRASVAPPPPPRESEDLLDELLGEPEPEPLAPPAAPGPKGVPVVVFGGAAQGLPQPPPPPRPPDITDEDLKVLEDLERMADGGEATLHTEKVKPARMVASLIRLLIRKRIIREEEFLEELSRK